MNADDSHIVVEVFEERIKKLFQIFMNFDPRFSVRNGFYLMAIIYFAEDSYHLGSMTTVLEWPLILLQDQSLSFILSLICLICGLFVKNLYKKTK